jgi:FdhD/NarQ family
MRPKEDGQLTGRTARRRVVRVTVPSDGFPGRAVARADLLATEEPLGIRVDGSALTVTMRTPGDDVELAAGFLVGEAVVRSRDDIAEIRLCDGTSCGHGGHDGMGNIADVLLAPGVEVGFECPAQLHDDQRVRCLRQNQHRGHLRAAGSVPRVR